MQNDLGLIWLHVTFWGLIFAQAQISQRVATNTWEVQQPLITRNKRPWNNHNSTWLPSNKDQFGHWDSIQWCSLELHWSGSGKQYNFKQVQIWSAVLQKYQKNDFLFLTMDIFSRDGLAAVYHFISFLNSVPTKQWISCVKILFESSFQRAIQSFPILVLDVNVVTLPCPT